MSDYTTKEGTFRFAEESVRLKKTNPNHFRNVQGLKLSSLGMGTYLGTLDKQTDLDVENAIKESIRSGAVNVVDTAINYRFQKAERCVGRALEDLFENEIATREQIFISTKNGYLAPDADYERGAGKYIADKLIATGIVRPDEIVDSSHCMTLPFLKHELKQSLANLKLETIDLLYLHNSAEAQIPAVGKKMYLENLRDVFEFYEGARKDGKIRFYGLATWDCFRIKKGEGHLNLEETLALAEDVGGTDHGFRFIQFPFNLAMPEALVLRNQTVGGKECALLEGCIELEMGAFTSVPLMQGQLIPRPGIPKVGTLTTSQSILQFARSAPGITAPLVGQKDRDHVRENLDIAKTAPLSLEEFERCFN